MKLADFKAVLQSLFSQSQWKKVEGKTMADYQRDILIKVGKAQFQRLQQLGLTVPVALS